jgi:hypothetical protein
MADPQWSFADFRLDPANACLWRGTQAVALTPKVFDVLHYLVTHADRLNQATQHWYTGSTHKRVISVRPGHRVYESRVA